MKTLRVNTLVTSQQQLLDSFKRRGIDLVPVGCSDTLFRLPREVFVRFKNFREFVEGKFYVQDLASTLPALALGPKPGDKVLDIAAAPGSKTTQMATMMNNTGTIVANDISWQRMRALRSVVKKQHVKNVTFLLGDGVCLGQSHRGVFDKVMVDAPCSSEGIIRYKPHKFFEWNLLLIQELVEIQKKLIVSGYEALKKGGELVYSTCTFGPEENEAVVNHLLVLYPEATLVPLYFEGVKTRPGLTHWNSERYDESLTQAVRLYPQDNDSIGFFIAKIKKGNA